MSIRPSGTKVAWSAIDRQTSFRQALWLNKLSRILSGLPLAGHAPDRIAHVVRHQNGTVRSECDPGPEHGTAAIDNFTEPKAVWMNLNV
jgi:hypothetical protein